MAATLEEMDEVVRYVKNQGLDFTIPYESNGDARQYVPDFIACIDDGQGSDDLLNLMSRSERVSEEGQAAEGGDGGTFWIPAVNNHGGFQGSSGLQWEVTDPWDAARTIRGLLSGMEGVAAWYPLSPSLSPSAEGKEENHPSPALPFAECKGHNE